jgi:hypothetical protein
MRRGAAVAALLCLASATAGADAAVAWRQRAAALDLARHPEWLALGHYAPDPGRGRHHNYVDDAAFFLSAAGSESPQAELDATLDAFFADPPTQCRFVARRQWLAANLPGLAASLPAVRCEQYEQWRQELAASRAVLVFAASYLNSPSSMYGHTFLRFDSANPERRAAMLAFALNFGATIPSDENGLVYAWRGLFGGYPGRFAAAPYFEKLREYSRLESRDLWEYPLNLDAAELDRMLAHIWELREVNFDYFFFDENCSLRLLELLDVARPGHDLAEKFPNYAIPVDTVRAVIDAGMVAGVEYRPANRTILEHEIRSLGPQERRLALRLAGDAAIADGAEFAALPADRQLVVAAVAYGYLRYRAARQPRDALTAQRSLDLLRIVNRSAPAGDPVTAPPLPPAPEDGHRTAMLSLAGGWQEGEGFADFEWRLSYHDLLDAPAGYPAGASLNMGRFVVRLGEGNHWQVQRVDLIEITSLSPRDAFFKPLSWRVDTGLDRQWTDGDDVLVPQVNGGAGWTFAPARGLTVFALATARLEYNHEMERELDIAPGASLGATLRSALGSTLLDIDHYHFTGGVDRARYALGHNVALRTNLALRLMVERSDTETDHVDEASVSLRYYF